jgi:adenylosuccinate lyase
VEYFIKENVRNYKEHIHFCCTSEDINNLAYSLMLKESLANVYVPTATKVLEKLIQHAVNWAGHPMLAHTHGQPASPTTLGKEYANFSYRLALQLSNLKKTKIYGKFNGAVGNYNAHYFVYPDLDWP